MPSTALALAAVLALPPQDPGEALPLVLVDRDDARIDRSCRVAFPPGAAIRDAKGDGVLHVVADGVRVEFEEGAELRGAPDGTPWDALEGVGIRVEGRRDVTIAGARLRGFRCGILATRCDGLVVEDGDFADHFRQRLRSTPEAEDVADWLAPHRNDANEWLALYGAAVYVEDSAGVTVRRSRVRRGQNGIVLDRVTDSRVYDNDASFLSGWGLALWRSSGNTIDHNAFDFCIRGYSHGVYSRGQDSAGILLFEQSSDNGFAWNSATHGGDGLFGFAGLEALGEGPVPEGFDHARAGSNRNRFEHNDFSFAAAHGLELTFGFGNAIRSNRFEGNALCGVWAGYCRESSIRGNSFLDNGGAGSGLERGGVCIEHGTHNRIVENVFLRDVCGVRLWWDPDEHLARLPWALANGTASEGNAIEDNRFEGCELGIHLASAGRTRVHGNRYADVGRELEVADTEVDREAGQTECPIPTGERARELSGTTRPVGARPALRGREHIVMTEWGPWDHASPLLRRVGVGEDGAHLYELRRLPSEPQVAVEGQGLSIHLRAPAEEPGLLAVSTEREGFVPYSLTVACEGLDEPLRASGTIERVSWRVRFFAWTVDPREDEAGWRAQGASAPELRLPRLVLPFGGGGPAALGLEGVEAAEGLPADRFGTLARASVPLEAGAWRVATVSDDGVRVRVDGRTVLENWTWHAPTRDEGRFALDAPRVVELAVEHFELDGHAVLELVLERVE